MKKRRRKPKRLPVTPETKRGWSFYLLSFSAVFAAILTIEMISGVSLGRTRFGESIDRVHRAKAYGIPLVLTVIGLFLRWRDKRGLHDVTRLPADERPTVLK